MAEGDHIDADDAVVRHCAFQYIQEDGAPGAGSFMLAGHTDLSVTSVKMAAPGVADLTEQLRAVKAAMSRTRGLGKQSGLALFAAADIRAITQLGQDVVAFTILHHPDNNPAHCGVHGITPSPSPVEELFAERLAGLHTHPVTRCGDL